MARNRIRQGWLAGIFLAGWLFSGQGIAATEPAGASAAKQEGLENHRCLRCHADAEEKHVLQPDGSKKNIFIERATIEKSVHGQVTCVGCHRDVTKLPHAKPLAGAIGCIECHKAESTKLKDDPDPKKRERLDVVLQQTESYLHSAHARPNVKNQAQVNAACHDCHDAHDIGKPGTLARKEHRLKNPEVCGRCHEKQKDDYLGSIHGKAITEKQDEKSAVCADCHTTHAISSTKADPAKLAITKNCGSCHDNAQKTYLASYHGQVHRLGYTNDHGGWHHP